MPFGVLAEDDEVDVLRAPPFERDHAVGERLDRADVGVEIEPETHAEENVARVLVRRNAGVAEGPEQDGAGLVLDALGDLLRVGGAVSQVAFGAEVEVPQVERQAPSVAIELEDARGLGDDLGPHAVAREDGDRAWCRGPWVQRYHGGRNRMLWSRHAPTRTALDRGAV